MVSFGVISMYHGNDYSILKSENSEDQIPAYLFPLLTSTGRLGALVGGKTNPFLDSSAGHF